MTFEHFLTLWLLGTATGVILAVVQALPGPGKTSNRPKGGRFK